MADFPFDPAVAEQILGCARRLTARGYVANQLGNVAMRIPHPAHVHHDETIALFASRAVKELRVLSLEFPLIMGRPPVVLPSHVDVEQDVGPVGGFIEGTNAIIMENHGVTTLGATLAEAYYRLNTLAAEVRRAAQAET